MTTAAEKKANPDKRWITVRVMDDMYAHLEQIAAEEERSLSSVVRVAVREYLERQGVTGQE